MTPWLLLLLVLATVAPFDGRASEARSVTGAPQQVLRVGPNQPFQRPSEAARVARDGAVVEIDAGEYEGEVAVWRQNDLTLRAAGRAAEGKAIWVIKGDRVTVENVELSGASVPSRNGAAIRGEGAGLMIRNSRLHHNEMGLLTNPSPNSVVIIEDSEIDRNTTDTERHGRLGHNIYVHDARLFILRNSHVHGARTGHQVKTCARRNEIRGNRIEDGDGLGSLLLDLSIGGQALVANNRFQQSARAGNRTAIGFAGEARDRGPKHARPGRAPRSARRRRPFTSDGNGPSIDAQGAATSRTIERVFLRLRCRRRCTCAPVPSAHEQHRLRQRRDQCRGDEGTRQHEQIATARARQARCGVAARRTCVERGAERLRHLLADSPRLLALRRCVVEHDDDAPPARRGGPRELDRGAA